MISPISMEFSIPTKIVFGIDSLSKIGETTLNYGNRVLLVTSGQSMRRTGLLDKVQNDLERNGLKVLVFEDVYSNPTSAVVDEATILARQAKCNVVVGLGSSSVINVAKSVSFLLNNDGFVLEYLNGKMGINSCMPCILIPTLFGVYNNVSPTFALVDANDRWKKIFVDEKVFPTITVIDPKTTITAPVNFIAASGLASISFAIEAYIANSSNAISDSLALRAIENISKSLKLAVNDRDNIDARSGIAMGTLLSGLAQLLSCFGACQALAFALTTKSDIYQNVATAIMLPHVMEFNLTAAPGKYVQIAKSLGEDVSSITVVEAAIKAVEGIRKLLFDLKIPQKLSEYNIKKEDFPIIASEARRYGFLNYVPRPLSREDLINILMSAF